MDDKQREEIREIISKEIEKTTITIKEYEEMTKPIAPENAIGRISRMDAINNKSVADAALRQAKRKLKNLQFALSKVDDKNFGHCRRCKNLIPIQRILLVPQSQFCVRCAH
ncbi:MAG: TraR/DksA C4-type zinc finger protein [Bacteroidota bacterium]